MQQSEYEREVNAKLEQTIGELTGGNGELLLSGHVEGNELIVIGSVVGSYPIFDVLISWSSISGEHYFRLEDKSQVKSVERGSGFLGTVPPHIWREIGRWNIPNEGPARIDISVVARNGNTRTYITARQVGKEWLVAQHRVRMERVEMPKNVKISEDMVPDGFPRGPDGTVLW